MRFPHDPAALDIEAILKEEILNVEAEELNELNIELFARAFYDIYIKA
ncbi:MAG TPA: hypothetical protein VLG50_03765 [Candidatus Saccharimonadales bacterium]|nr:hypothetical protein [Candidatus Saccharimonadales bacterium]